MAVPHLVSGDGTAPEASIERSPGWGVLLVRHLIAASAFMVAVMLGYMSMVPIGTITTVWPAAGVVVVWIGALGRTGRERWGIVAATMAIAVPLCSALGIPPELIPSSAIGFGALALTADVILRHGGRDPMQLRTSRDLYHLTGAALAASAVSATIRSVGMIHLGYTTDLAFTWLTWIMRDALSIVVLASAYMTFRTVRRRLPCRRTVLVSLLLVPAVGLFGIALFATAGLSLALPLSAAALCIWIAERFPTHVTALLNIVVSTMIIFASLTGDGLFGTFSLQASVLEAQALSMIFTIMTYVVALRRDEQDRLRRTLRRSEAEFRTAFESAPVGMVKLFSSADGKCQIHRANNQFAAMVDGSAECLVGTSMETLLAPADRPALRAAARRVLTGNPEHHQFEAQLDSGSARTRWVSVSLAAVPVDNEATDSLLVVIEDITDRREEVISLEQQARFDPLTGLYNRRELLARLAGVHRDGDLPTAVYLLDLDGFKAVNDRSGHSVGDQLLRTVAGRLSAIARPGDTVARLGGDEFVVVHSGRDAVADIRTVAEQLLTAVGRPASQNKVRLTTTVSIGATITRPGMSPEDVLREADRAMYAAKRSGRGRVVIDRFVDARPGETVEVSDIERALAHNEFEVFGQPIIDLVTGAITAFECLLRWRHPQRGLLGPGAFLELVEATPLVHDVGNRVIDLSLALAASAWPDTARPTGGLTARPCAVHINVSGHMLETGTLAGTLRDAARRHGVSLDRIVLELTESYAPMLELISLDDLEALRRDGVRIAIDDVGTGHSSLARIAELPVDMLKIDGRFIASIGHDPRCDAVIRAVISIGRALNLTVVGEGVETHRQHEVLRASGCDQGQGFTYARPLDGPALRRKMSRAPRSLSSEHTTVG